MIEWITPTSKAEDLKEEDEVNERKRIKEEMKKDNALDTPEEALEENLGQDQPKVGAQVEVPQLKRAPALDKQKTIGKKKQKEHSSDLEVEQDELTEEVSQEIESKRKQRGRQKALEKELAFAKKYQKGQDIDNAQALKQEKKAIKRQQVYEEYQEFRKDAIAGENEQINARGNKKMRRGGMEKESGGIFGKLLEAAASIAAGISTNISSMSVASRIASPTSTPTPGQQQNQEQKRDETVQR